MSKTDKTKPCRIKLAHGDLDWREIHDHTTGPCDLGPVDDVESYRWTAASGQRCWRNFVYTGTRVCCCKACRDDSWDLRPGKRQRLADKRACQDWVNEY